MRQARSLSQDVREPGAVLIAFQAWSRTMKVRDVLLQLKGLDRDVELLCFCNDEGSRRRDTPFLVYAVQRIDATLMSLGASGARPPAVVFGPGRNARQVAVLEITSDF